MESGNPAGNDMAPHSAIVQIHWEVHEKKQDGTYYGSAKDGGTVIYSLNAQDRALANEYLNALLELIKKAGTNVDELEIDRERLRQAQVQGASRPREYNPNVFSMRGKIGRNSTSGPRSPGDV